MTEQEKRADFGKYWVRPLQEMNLEQGTMEEIGDPQGAAIAKAMGIPLSEILKSGEKELDKWFKGIQQEVDSLKTREVYDQITKHEAYHKYWKHNIKTNRLPGQLLCAKKPDEEDDDGSTVNSMVRVRRHGCQVFAKDT